MPEQAGGQTISIADDLLDKGQCVVGLSVLYEELVPSGVCLIGCDGWLTRKN